MAGLSIRCGLVAISKTRGLPALNIDLPVDKIKRWLIHRRAIDAVTDIVECRLTGIDLI